MQEMNILKLGIPKGSLEKATLRLFEKSGWKISIADRNYFPQINDASIRCSILRAQEMPVQVENGTIDVGLTGRDWKEENESDVVTVSDLIYSKVSQSPARWVLAVAADSDIKEVSDLTGKKIATELVNFTRKYFAQKGVEVKVEFSWGTTEAKVATGLADAIVEVTETGSTIEAHGLKIIHELMQTNTILIANKNAWGDSWKRSKIEQIALLLKGALRAENMVGLKMNLPKERLVEIIPLLPSITSPTIASLYQSDWVSVEIMVHNERVRELIPQLIEKGAEGIIEYPLNKVI
ncbi:MAG: ATP phosphoribosyltransferase [Desulfobacteraceae bacterium]|nr:MAG: ATP phosphoribosyltransferase [Desulfobacteraceae bacterium]